MLPVNPEQGDPKVFSTEADVLLCEENTINQKDTVFHQRAASVNDGGHADQALAFEKAKNTDLHKRIHDLERRVAALSVERDALKQREETLLTEQVAERIRGSLWLERGSAHVAHRKILGGVRPGRHEFSVDWPEIRPDSHLHIGFCETIHAPSMPAARHIGFKGDSDCRLISVTPTKGKLSVVFECAAQASVDLIATITLLLNPDQEIFSVTPLMSGADLSEHVQRRRDAYLQNLETSGLSDEEFVRTLYRVLLQREADPGGFESHIAALKAGPDGRRRVIKAIIGSKEWQSLYPEALGAPAGDTRRRKRWPRRSGAA